MSGGYWANGHWVDIKDATLQASTTLTASANSTEVDIGDRGTLCLTLAVTARSGTNPTLDAAVQTSADKSTWRTLGSFTQATAVGSERKSFAGCDRYARVASTIGGTTPSFTFSVTGDAK